MAKGRGDPRGTHQWKRIRLLVLAGKTHCARCGLPFILQPARNPRSPSVDHIVPIVLGGAPYALSNLLAVCYGCNSRAGQFVARRRTYKPPRQVHRW
jgi:5-methylcytosine-specific restriction endonuclease McrA